ncbi:MAG: glycosyl hydrolase [Verrucomicrobiota bacterium]
MHKIIDVPGVGVLALLSLTFLTAPTEAQNVVSVGSGSYASSLPAAVQWIGGFYSMSPQQVVTQYEHLHVDSSLTNRPMPSNKWWTDVLVGDRSYQPQGGGPRVIQQDAFGGQLWSYPAMLTPNASGFSLYYPNSWNARSNPNMPEGGFATGPALQVSGAIPLAVGSNDVLIADFDGTNYPAGWTVTGTAFGSGPIQGGSWSGQSPPVQGFLGAACVNTYRGSDAPQGTLTSPVFTIQKRYVHVLAGGGINTNYTAVRVRVNGTVIYAACGRQSGTLYWNTWDLSAYLGQPAQIEIIDLTSGSWGFILCSWIVASDDGSDPSARYAGSYSPVQSCVTGWSDWGVQFSLPDAAGRRMEITLARGVPFVWTTCSGVQPSLNIGSAVLYDTNGASIPTASGSFNASTFACEYQGRVFGVFAPDNTRFTVSSGHVTAQLDSTNNYLVYGLLPSRTNLAEFAQYAYARVTNTVFDWAYDPAGGRVTTTWSLETSPLKGTQTNTLQGWLPHHYRTTENALAFRPYTWLTPRGVLKVAPGNRFQIAWPFHGIAPVLPAPAASGLANDYQPARLTNYVAAFAAGNPYNVGDSYGAGKEVALSAQYMTFARRLGMNAQATKLAAGLRSILADWYTYTPGEAGNYFARYGNWGALIGFPPGYGSEAFNDNHFHYGYFALATALLGTEDALFLSQYGPMARIVAREYANWDRSDTNYPFLRTFDIWEGHSCAGGFSSGGGENQESSSEAMNSWVGIFMLGNQLQDDAMTAAGAMGYSVESAAVNEYWQDWRRENLPASYGKGMVGVVWSGALAYGTYFSGDPAWIYGIQWVPANHWNNYLARDPAFANWQLTNLWTERVVASQYGISGFTLADANNAAALGGYLGNYVLGFQSLFDPDGVASILDAAWATNGAVATDGAYAGVSYYLAHSLRVLGAQDPSLYADLPTSQVYTNARTGLSTVIAYNPGPSDRLVTVYAGGSPVSSFTAPAGAWTSRALSGSTNPPPAAFAIAIQPGAAVSWPTAVQKFYAVQWAPASSPASWTDLTNGIPGDGTVQSLFDPLGGTAHAGYQVLEWTLGAATNLVANGGFESGTGSAADGWAESGSQPPARVATDAHGGTFVMQLSVTNAASTPNNSEIHANLVDAGGGAVIPGQVYTFSFWARQVSSGPSLVQNYQLTWLAANGAGISGSGWIGFSGGNGTWKQIALTNTAPANAVNAYIQIYNVTGAVAGGYGSVQIDDLTLSAPALASGQTNAIAATVQPTMRIQWPSIAGRSYDVQSAANPAAPGGWTDRLVTGNGTTNVVYDPADPAARFYRVLLMP